MKKNIILKLILCTITSLNTQIKCSKALDILKTLNIDQKIGQLFIANVSNATDGNNPEKSNLKNIIITGAKRFPERTTPEYVTDLIKNYHIAGIHFTQFSTIDHTKASISKFQKLSTIPLIISQDFEYGAAMRLLDAPKLPNHMTLGAIQDLNIIYEVGKEIAKQCKALGVNLNFAPVADVNNNQLNPIIGSRSFGQNPKNVALKAIELMRGMLDGGILCCAKHFPGHGDTNVDSHQALPIIAHNKERLEKIELYPFKELIKAGIPCVMTGHLNIPAYGSKPGESATTSKEIVTGLLRNRLNFNGLIITDGLDMRALTDFYEPGYVDLAAFMAGVDILLLSEDIPNAHKLIKQAILDGKICQAELDKRVLRILRAKERIGLFDDKNRGKERPFPLKPDIKKRAYQAAITLVNGQLPKLNRKQPISYMQFGQPQNNNFENLLKKELVISEAQNTDTVIVSIFGQVQAAKYIKDLGSKYKSIILVIFGSPYNVKYFDGIKNIVVAYEDDPDAQEAAALVLLGKRKATGKLPVLQK